MGWGQHVSEISSKATKTLGFLRRNLAFAPRSTKEVAYKTLVWPKLEYAALTRNFTLIRLRKFRGQQPAGPAGDGETRVVSGTCLASFNGHLWGPVGTSPPCLSFTRFIVEQCQSKKTYMTPAHSLKTTRPSHSAQYHRNQTYSDALRNPPKLFHSRIVCLLLWSISSPQRSLGHSLIKQKFSQKFFFIFIFFILSKFQN